VINLKQQIRLVSLSLFLLILLLVPFTAAAAEATVAVTIVPQIEMVEAIVGDKVEVVEMIPKGFSPSNYAPSPAEMRAFNKAGIYFSMGVPADIQNILPRAEAVSGLKVIKLFEEIEAEYPNRYFGERKEQPEDEAANEHSHQGGRDPHIWLSPDRVKYMVQIMRDELIKILPQYENEFKENAAQYLSELAAADQENSKLLAPYQGESILVYHPSFGYFTEHYGLEMMAIEEEGKDPGPRHLQDIIKMAAEKGIKNVFYQAEIDSRKTRAVAEELSGDIVELNPLAENYIQNLKVMAQKMAAELAERDDK
jgi:zinc transport system substrate-binding protein